MEGEWSSPGGESGKAWQRHGLDRWDRDAEKRAIFGHGEEFGVVGIETSREK